MDGSKSEGSFGFEGGWVSTTVKEESTACWSLARMKASLEPRSGVEFGNEESNAFANRGKHQGQESNTSRFNCVTTIFYIAKHVGLLLSCEGVSCGKHIRKPKEVNLFCKKTSPHLQLTKVPCTDEELPGVPEA